MLDTYHIYTDGACSGNPGPAAWAAVINQGTKKTEISGYLGYSNNNMAELEAVYQSLLHVGEESEVHIYTDSLMVIHWLVFGFKSKNLDISKKVEEIKKTIYHKEIETVFYKVSAHEDDSLNNRADYLARVTIIKNVFPPHLRRKMIYQKIIYKDMCERDYKRQGLDKRN